MNALVFDTLALARKLEATGMSAAQAQGVSAALAETLGEHIATRRDLAEAEGRLRADLRDLEQRLTIRLGGMLAAAVALMAALVKVL